MDEMGQVKRDWLSYSRLADCAGVLFIYGKSQHSSFISAEAPSPNTQDRDKANILPYYDMSMLACRPLATAQSAHCFNLHMT